MLDIATGAIRDYTVPFRLFGMAFTRDGQSLLVSTRDGRTMARLNLAGNVLAATASTPVKMHALLQTPSGKSVYTYVSETAMTVRRVADMRQVASIPTNNLFPGIERILPSDQIMTTVDGKFLLAPIYDLSSFTVDTGFRLYEVPDDIDSAGAPGPVSTKIQADKLFNTALRFARDNDIRFTTYHTKGVGDPTESFAPAVIAGDGNVLLGGTRDIGTMDLTRPRKKPVVACVSPDGKARWV